MGTSLRKTKENDLYFAINAYTAESGNPEGEDKNTVQIVYKIDGKDQYSTVSLSLPYRVNSTHRQLHCDDIDGTVFFSISDMMQNTVVFSTDFSSPEVSVFSFSGLNIDDLIFNQEKYPELFEVGQNKGGRFKIYDGVARLITFTNRGVGTLYTQEEVK